MRYLGGIQSRLMDIEFERIQKLAKLAEGSSSSKTINERKEMFKCIEDESHGVLICMGKPMDYELFEGKLKAFKGTPPSKVIVESMLTENDALIAYSTVAKAIGQFPVFISEDLGVSWDELLRIYQEFCDRGHLPISEVAGEQLKSMGFHPKGENDTEWLKNRDCRVSSLIKREAELDVARRLPQLEV